MNSPKQELGTCDYSAIHGDTLHYFEDQTCVNWRPASPPERPDVKRQTEILDAAVKQFGSAGESHPAGRPALNELLESARKHVMTDEEKEAQRQSWVRGEMALSESERGMTSVLPPSAHVCKFPDSPTDGREWSCSQCNVIWCWQAGVWEAVGEVEVSQPSALDWAETLRGDIFTFILNECGYQLDGPKNQRLLELLRSYVPAVTKIESGKPSLACTEEKGAGTSKPDGAQAAIRQVMREL